jgi:hypothetical protein
MFRINKEFINLFSRFVPVYISNKKNIIITKMKEQISDNNNNYSIINKDYLMKILKTK